MYYVLELFKRSQYIFFAFFLTIICCYYHKLSLFLIAGSVLFSLGDSCLTQQHFIYTHPLEVFNINLYLIFIFTCYIILPYFIWQCLDVIKPGLYLNEYKVILTYVLWLFFYTGFIYLMFFFILFPIVWNFFKTFNLFEFYFCQFFFELKVYDFIFFMFDLLIFLNWFLLILICLIILLIYCKIQKIIFFKKICYLSILMLATFCSPPDIFSQIGLGFFLLVWLEIMLLVSIFKYSLNTYDRTFFLEDLK